MNKKDILRRLKFRLDSIEKVLEELRPKVDDEDKILDISVMKYEARQDELQVAYNQIEKYLED